MNGRAPIIPPRSRPHGERRLLSDMKENQAGNSLVLNVVRFPGDAPDTSELQTIWTSAFKTLIQNNAEGDDDGTVVTCSLGVVNGNALVAAELAVPQSVIAQVRFGVGAAAHKAFVTVRQGTQVSVPSTSFQIDMAAFISGAVGGEPQGHASVNYGTRPGFLEPTFDLYRTAAAGGPGATVDCVVPPFARNVSIIPSDPTMLTAGTGTNLRILQGSLATVPVINSIADPGRLRNVPLAYDPVSIELVNGSGVGGVYFISFSLAL